MISPSVRIIANTTPLPTANDNNTNTNDDLGKSPTAAPASTNARIGPAHGAHTNPVAAPITTAIATLVSLFVVPATDGVSFEPSNRPPARDATGEVDYGNIDSFVPADWDGDPAWELSGDWGKALVRQPDVTLVLDA